MSPIFLAKSIVEKQILNRPRLRNRKIIQELFDQKWPRNLDEFYPVYEDDPEEGSNLYLNLSSCSYNLWMSVTAASEYRIPNENEPITVRVFNDDMFLAKVTV